MHRNFKNILGVAIVVFFLSFLSIEVTDSWAEGDEAIGKVIAISGKVEFSTKEDMGKQDN
jgi:hypothetical protein|tara:strand:+ start:124 stop:303 length:180 start_codon:yes stop_codon:yes gene_type:complete